MARIRAVAKDIGKLITFRYDRDEPQSTNGRIAAVIVAIASFMVIFSLWYWG